MRRLNVVSDMSFDEKDELVSLKRQDAYPALLKQLDILLHDYQQTIFRERLDLNNPVRIALIKARIEGAEELHARIKSTLASLK